MKSPQQRAENIMTAGEQSQNPYLLARKAAPRITSLLFRQLLQKPCKRQQQNVGLEPFRQIIKEFAAQNMLCLLGQTP